ncbi:MAG TPA: sigma-70 family RNA polymerase sigma factor [Gemmataceae bacterium]|nr:sigma-70 family RNA polymerase sigma factor [Gemmataceae bacterium]
MLGRMDSTPEEGRLVAALRAGDGAAFETLVRTCGGPMLAVAGRILRNDEDAREAVQDAFLSAFRSLDRFDGHSAVATWLHRIAVNAALMKLRARRRKPERSIEDMLPHFTDDEHQTDPPTAWPGRADDVAQRHELRAIVRGCIDQLPEIYRTVLLLRDIEGLDTEEAARLLGANGAVVKTRLHRARQALRTLLAPHMRDV